MIKGVIKETACKLEELIDKLLCENELQVVSASRYSILNSGKRIRPVLLMEFYKLCGGKDYNAALKFAAALEMIHTYSLIHDDLPCMDNDDMRRGKPSCHKQFSEATALLAGDMLLTKAFYTAALNSEIPSERKLEAISILADMAGENGMIGGQEIDLAIENKSASIEVITEMYLKKTAALLVAACKIGCILAGATEEKILLAKIYAEKLGLAFQIIDDILDITADEKQLGKPVGSDDKNNKSTYVSKVGIEKSREAATRLTNEAMDILENFSGDTSALKELTILLLDRNK
ncbi:MAG: polyprenyl synthetase family protein [Clostridia bacterium]|nr:polyprenyl synthetase family protein [Clostridia bacterium]